MSDTITSPIAADHAALAAIVKASAAYDKTAVSFKAVIIKSVETFRKEGHTDDVIRVAIREALKDSDVSRQFVNRVLTTEADKGGCGMPKERNHDKGKGKGKGEAEGKGATSVTIDICDPLSLFSAMFTKFGGNAVKVMLVAEKLNELAAEAQLKASATKAAK
jgi:hypothetical protein